MRLEEATTAELYLRDLSALLKERALEAREQRRGEAEDGDGYAVGRLMAYHEVISLMRDQAVAFGISLEALGLSDVEPERDLL